MRNRDKYSDDIITRSYWHIENFPEGTILPWYLYRLLSVLFAYKITFPLECAMKLWKEIDVQVHVVNNYDILSKYLFFIFIACEIVGYSNAINDEDGMNTRMIINYLKSNHHLGKMEQML